MLGQFTACDEQPFKERQGHWQQSQKGNLIKIQQERLSIEKLLSYLPLFVTGI